MMHVDSQPDPLLNAGVFYGPGVEPTARRGRARRSSLVMNEGDANMTVLRGDIEEFHRLRGNGKVTLADLSEADRMEIEDCFKALQEPQKKLVTLARLIVAAEMVLGPGTYSERNLVRGLKAMDSNAAGSVSWIEFRAYMSHNWNAGMSAESVIFGGEKDAIFVDHASTLRLVDLIRTYRRRTKMERMLHEAQKELIEFKQGKGDSNLRPEGSSYDASSQAMPPSENPRSRRSMEVPINAGEPPNRNARLSYISTPSSTPLFDESAATNNHSGHPRGRQSQPVNHSSAPEAAADVAPTFRRQPSVPNTNLPINVPVIQASPPTNGVDFSTLSRGGEKSPLVSSSVPPPNPPLRDGGAGGAGGAGSAGAGAAKSALRDSSGPQSKLSISEGGSASTSRLPSMPLSAYLAGDNGHAHHGHAHHGASNLTKAAAPKRQGPSNISTNRRGAVPASKEPKRGGFLPSIFKGSS